MGDLILLELSRGARDDAHAEKMGRALRAFPVVSLLDPHLAAQAGAKYRALRAVGITVRKTADLVIANYCIERGIALLHRDRGFVPFEQHFGLKPPPLP